MTHVLGDITWKRITKLELETPIMIIPNRVVQVKKQLFNVDGIIAFSSNCVYVSQHTMLESVQSGNV